MWRAAVERLAALFSLYPTVNTETAENAESSKKQVAVRAFIEDVSEVPAGNL